MMACVATTHQCASEELEAPPEDALKIPTHVIAKSRPQLRPNHSIHLSRTVHKTGNLGDLRQFGALE